MPQLNVYIPKDLERWLDEHPEVPRSEVVQKALRRLQKRLEKAEKQEATA